MSGGVLPALGCNWGLSVGLQGAGRAAGLHSVCGSPKCYCSAVRQTPKVFTPLRSKKFGDPVQLVVFLF